MKKIILTLLIAFATSPICNSQQIIAGIGTPGYSGNGSTAIGAQLDRPRHLAFDNIGNLYFVEQGNHIVRKIDVNGIISTIAGNGTNGYSGDGGLAVTAQFNSPRGICIDSNGNIWFGTIMGAVRFNPKEDIFNSVKPLRRVDGTQVIGCSPHECHVY